MNTNYLREMFFNNLFLKIVSLIFAVTVWLYISPVALRDTLEVTYSLPLELKNIPNSIMTVGKIEDRINVRVKGRQSVIKEINPEHLSVSLDLSSAREGTRFYRINTDNINLPPNAEVTRIDPKTLKIDLVRLIKKDIDLKVHLTGKPAPGYRIKRVSWTPERITVEGPESEINELSFPEGVTVNVTGRKSGFSKEIKIGLPLHNVRIIGRDVVTVDVEVERS